jgi:hypothetical protein
MNMDFQIPSDEAHEITGGFDMRRMLPGTFEIYVDDDRYAVPTLHLVVADDPAMAHAIAQRLIDDSPHHLGAEICLDGERLDGLGSFALRSIPPGTSFREPDVLE